MKTLVTYKSKYGSAKQYAKWLAEALKCDAVDLKKVSPKMLSGYDVIIHGGGLYAGGLAGISFYKKHKDLLSGKRFLIYATGASPYEDKVITEVRKRNLDGFFDEAELFYCEGNYNYPKMTLTHKMMMRMMNSMINKHIKEGVADENEKGLHEVIFASYEHADKKFLEPILECVKNLR